MAENGSSSVGHWIAIAGVLVAVPSALVAWQALTDESATPPAVPVITTEGGPAGPTSESRVPETDQSGTPSGDSFDVAGCVITVDHIGAQIHSEPNHAARVLASVPDGDYRPSAATESDWAGLTEIWYQLTVDGRTGWLPYSTITVRSVSSDCP